MQSCAEYRGVQAVRRILEDHLNFLSLWSLREGFGRISRYVLTIKDHVAGRWFDQARNDA